MTTSKTVAPFLFRFSQPLEPSNEEPVADASIENARQARAGQLEPGTTRKTAIGRETTDDD